MVMYSRETTLHGFQNIIHDFFKVWEFLFQGHNLLEMYLFLAADHEAAGCKTLYDISSNIIGV